MNRLFRAKASSHKFQFALVIHSLQLGKRVQKPLETKASIVWRCGPRTAVSDRVSTTSGAHEAGIYRWPSDKPLLLMATLFRSFYSSMYYFVFTPSLL